MPQAGEGFYEQINRLDDAVVPLWAATEAARREMEPEGPVVVACDVARYGHDKTVVMRRQGPVARIVRRVRGHSTMETATGGQREHRLSHLFNFLKGYCNEHEVETLGML